MVARLLVATLLLGGLLFLMLGNEGALDGFTPRFLIGLIATLFGVSLVTALWVRTGQTPRKVAAAQIVADLLITTGLIYVTGGSSSGFTFLYGVAALMAAMVVGPRAARITGIAAIALYCGLTLSLWLHVLPPPPDQPAGAYTAPSIEVAYAAMLPLAGLILVTLLAGDLAARLHAAGSQLRRAEASAVTLARLNDDIVRSMSSGLLTTDKAGNIRTVNAFGANLLGGDAESLIGKSAGALLPGIEKLIRHAVDEPHLFIARAECRVKRPITGDFPVGFSVTPLISVSGHETGSLIVFQDLTEIEQLRATATRQERLAVLGRLSAGLAHEIRNPLSSISGSVQLVRDSAPLNAEDHRLLGIVLDEVDRLNELVNTMLQVGRPREPQKVRTDLRLIASDVAHVNELGLVRESNVHLEVKVPDTPVLADVDAAQIRQVVWNLLKNAIQASPSEATVTVAADWHETSGNPRIWVRDEGDGLDATQQTKVYEMFHSERTHGTGIGLALVRQIVDAHDASITIVSDTGRGAMFVVEFPPAKSSDNAKRD